MSELVFRAVALLVSLFVIVYEMLVADPPRDPLVMAVAFTMLVMSVFNWREYR